ncbi:MAG: Na(+)/H(+) antiporter subunit B [Deltaproteobacteria bacterium]|nr:Na(+)/H(+) antiporter subunit B [Deltaproteobacteria bacterium]
MSLLFDIVLSLIVVALAVRVIVAEDGFAAVVSFAAYGLLVALAWVRLYAADVSLTEVAISGGLAGMLLIGAASRLRAIDARAAAQRSGRGVRLFAALLSCGVAGGLGLAVLALPDPAPSLAEAAVANLPPTGVGNPVTAVLMAFRATDTLLETVVVVLALVGVWSLAPDRLWGGRPGAREHADPNGPLAFLARVLPPIGVVVAVYLLWAGASEPGGAFQGGAILAATWLLVIMAGLSDAPATHGHGLRWLLVAGPLLFLAVGFAGIWLADAFLAYPTDWAKALIVAVEVAKLLSVAAALGLLLLGPPRRIDTP